ESLLLLSHPCLLYPLFFFTVTPPSHISTLSLHDALPISRVRSAQAYPSSRPSPSSSPVVPPYPFRPSPPGRAGHPSPGGRPARRSEEHTSELQSRGHLVCRLLLEKKNRADEMGAYLSRGR